MLLPAVQAVKEITEINEELSAQYICEGCEEVYESEPAPHTMADYIRRSNIETLSLEVPDGVEMLHLIPGRHGSLYGGGMLLNNSPDTKDERKPSSFFRSKGRGRMWKAIQTGDGDIAWTCSDADAVFAGLIPTPVQHRLALAFDSVDGTRPVANEDHLRELLDANLPIWANVEHVASAPAIQRTAAEQLVHIHRKMAWWSRPSVRHMDVLNMRFNHLGDSGRYMDSRFSTADFFSPDKAKPVPKKMKKGAVGGDYVDYQNYKKFAKDVEFNAAPPPPPMPKP